VTTQEGEITLLAEHILIATGSEPVVPPIPGIALEGVITSDELLTQTSKRFDRLVIIGGGVIGMEFASIYSAFGCRVTVIEAQERILATLDREIAQNLKMILKKRGVDILNGARVLRFESSHAGKPLCVFEVGGEEQTLEADGVLVAVGRKAVTKGLFENALDLACTGGGCIAVDENMQTALPGIWAIGDVTGGVQLAHAAAAQGKRAVAAMFGEKCTLRTDLIPVCVYTDPEIACIGMDADDAKTAGLQVKTRKIAMNSNGKSLLSMQERGFIKTVEDAQSGRLLGAQMMCARATDMISEFSLAIANNMTAEQLGQIIRPHPTFNEAVGELFEK
jgi:dihydrolipoamide dehydrogenase